MSHPQPFRAAGLLGWPVAHSRSRLLHLWWLRQYGINGDYVPMPVRPGQLAAALRGLVALGFAGCNVTVPHKEEASRLVDHLDPLARRLGAVNLIRIGTDGSLSGSNTDGYGFVQNLRDVKSDWRADARPVVVMGAGGSARSVLPVLLDEGATEIRLVNRTRERAEELATRLGPRVRVCAWAEREEALAGVGLLVNTTSAGMAGQPPLPLRLDALPTEALVYDLNYNPLCTPLLAAAAARGNPVVDGLGMLLHQARPSFQAWFDVLPDITPELRRALEASLESN
jgi:shikimate dehydrogenase